MDIMTKEDSYVVRRQLFKNIWETAMQIDEKDADIMAKPKVIKTLRLDEVDKCVIGKRKKERIRNLRTVCNKILDFCDRQDADDVFYEQIAEGKEVPHQKIELKLRKKRARRGRKKVKAKSSYPLYTTDQAKATTSERKDSKPLKKPSTDASANRVKRTTIVRRIIVRHRNLKGKLNLDINTDVNNVPGKTSGGHRKVMRRKRIKRKKTSAPHASPPRPPGASNNLKFVSPQLPGRAIVRHIKKLLTENTIVVTSTSSTNEVSPSIQPSIYN